MRRRISVALFAGLMVGVMAIPAGVSAAETVDLPLTFEFPDLENELVAFINTDRASYCTPEVIAFEYAIFDWLIGGMVGPPPPEPVFPDGDELVTVRFKETGKGALVIHIDEDDLAMELWAMDSPENRPFVGPCTDTDDDGAFFASGTTSFKNNDNDLFGSGSRGNAFGRRGTASVTDADGTEYSYTWRFHLNSRCYTPEDGPPACLIDTAKLVAE